MGPTQVFERGQAQEEMRLSPVLNLAVPEYMLRYREIDLGNDR